MAEDNAAGTTSLTLSPAAAPPGGARLTPRLGLPAPGSCLAAWTGPACPCGAGVSGLATERSLLAPLARSSDFLQSQCLGCADFSVKSLKSRLRTLDANHASQTQLPMCTGREGVLKCHV